MIPCSVLLEGEYRLENLCIGVPCIIGKNGLESIVDLGLNDAEQEKLNQSASAVKTMNKALKDVLK